MVCRLCLPRFIAIAMTVYASVAAANAQSYQAVFVNPLPGMFDLSLHDIDNNLRGVGTYRDGALRPHPFVRHPDGRIERLHRLDEDVDVCGPHCRLRINNRGQIAGLRTLSATDHRSPTLFLFSDVTGAGYAEVALPPNSQADSIHWTDSGRLLAYNTFGVGAWELYQSRLDDLSDYYVRAIGEDGTIGGQTRLGALPIIRFRDGPSVFPWDIGTVTAIGPAGHFAGDRFLGNPAIFKGQPAGSVVEIPTPRTARVADINFSGDLVGGMSDNLAGDISHGFLYRDGAFIDLNTIVSIPDRYISGASVINDDGVILATASRVGEFFAAVSVLLIPTPAAPGSVLATVAASRVTVTWQSVPGAVEYVVEAGTAPGRSDLYNASVGAATSVAATLPNGTYYARVRAKHSAGVGPASNEAVFTIEGCSAPPVTPVFITSGVENGIALVRWTEVPGASSYFVEAGAQPGSADIFSGDVGSAAQASASVATNFRAYVRVYAVNACGRSAPSPETLVQQ